MKDKTIALLTILLAMPMAISSVEATNWVEVVRFTGSGTTDYFTCDHIEWRIRWEYIPDENYPNSARLMVFIYCKGEDIHFDSFLKAGASEQSGATYVHNKNGIFYMEITVIYTESHTIIVEQDVDSIPEFTPVALIIGLTIVTASAVVLSKKKLFVKT